MRYRGVASKFRAALYTDMGVTQVKERGLIVPELYILLASMMFYYGKVMQFVIRAIKLKIQLK